MLSEQNQRSGHVNELLVNINSKSFMHLRMLIWIYSFFFNYAVWPLIPGPGGATDQWRPKTGENSILVKKK